MVDPVPIPTVLEPKPWTSSKIIIFCILTALAAGADAVAGSPVLDSAKADIFTVIANVVIAILRGWFTSQPIGKVK